MSLGKYEYKCKTCGRIVRSDKRGDRLFFTHMTPTPPGPTCSNVNLVRVFGFSMAPVMKEHFNQAVGRPISSMRQFREELKRKSDEATAQTGIEHRFAPLEYGDHAAFGATGEGIDESNRFREKRGLPLLPDIG